MPSLRKVLDGLEACASGQRCFKACPYNDHIDMGIGKCTTDLAKDALALLREQNSKIIELKKERERLKEQDRVKVVRCGDCRYWEPPSKDGVEDGCPYGRCHHKRTRADVDEFCSSGERK